MKLKNKIFQTSFVIITALFLFGCTKHQKPKITVYRSENAIAITINPSKAKKINFSDIYQIEKYIPLEVKDESLFSDLISASVINGKIITFVDYTLGTKKVLCFNDKGRYLYEIGRQGNGPGEFTALQDISINRKENTVFLLDLNKILVYDLKGNYIETKPLDRPYNEIKTLDSLTVLMSRNGSFGNRFPYHVESFYNNKRDGEFVKIAPLLSNGSALNYKRLAGYDGNTTFLQEFCDSVINNFTDGTFKPYIKIDFGDYSFTRNSKSLEEINVKNNKTSESSFLLKRKIWEQNLVTDINRYYENDNYIQMSYFFDKNNNQIIVNKQTDEVLFNLNRQKTSWDGSLWFMG